MGNLTEEQRILLVYEHKNGASLNSLAKKYNVTKKTARKWAERHTKGCGFKDKTGRGRQKMISPSVAKEALNLLTSNEFNNAQEVSNELHQQGKINSQAPPHRTTLVRAAKQAAKAIGEPLKAVRGEPAKDITEVQKAKRLAFCKANLRRSWHNVMFTDRAKFKLKHPGVKVSPVRWQLGKKKPAAYTVSKPLVVNVYAGITKYGVSKLHFVAGTSKMKTQYKNKKGDTAKNVTSSEYKDVFTDTFLPEARRIFSAQGMSSYHIQQDNDPTHSKASAAAIKEWNSRHNSSVSIIPNWPPNSPDLNLIENVWAIVDSRVKQEGCSSFEEFQETVTRVFNQLEATTLENLFSSMKRRLQSCIELNGARTKY